MSRGERDSDRGVSIVMLTDNGGFSFKSFAALRMTGERQWAGIAKAALLHQSNDIHGAATEVSVAPLRSCIPVTGAR